MSARHHGWPLVVVGAAHHVEAMVRAAHAVAPSMPDRYPRATGLEGHFLVARFVHLQQPRFVTDVEGAPTRAVPSDLGVRLRDGPPPVDELISDAHVARAAAAHSNDALARTIC